MAHRPPERAAAARGDGARAAHVDGESSDVEGHLRQHAHRDERAQWPDHCEHTHQLSHAEITAEEIVRRSVRHKQVQALLLYMLDAQRDVSAPRRARAPPVLPAAT